MCLSTIYRTWWPGENPKIEMGYKIFHEIKNSLGDVVLYNPYFSRYVPNQVGQIRRTQQPIVMISQTSNNNDKKGKKICYLEGYHYYNNLVEARRKAILSAENMSTLCHVYRIHAWDIVAKGKEDGVQVSVAHCYQIIEKVF